MQTVHIAAVLGVLLIFGGVEDVVSYSMGPILEGTNVPICTSLVATDVNHFQQSATANPALSYTITRSPAAYNPGQPVTVTLSGVSGASFTGFMIQARQVDNDVIVGTWTTTPTGSRRISCSTTSAAGYYETGLCGQLACIYNTLGHNANTAQTTLSATWLPSQRYLASPTTATSSAIYFRAVFTGRNPSNTATTVFVPTGSTTTTNMAYSDTTNPNMVCPSDQVLYVNVNGMTKTTTFSAPTGTDNSGQPLAGTTVTHNSGDAFPFNLVTAVVATGTDTSGNNGFCFFTISVMLDTTPPVLTSCATQTVTVSNSVPFTPVTFNTVTATDNTGIAPSITYSIASGTNFNVGTNTLVTATATDSAGNTAACSFNVIVQTSASVPVLTCSTSPVMVTYPCGATSATSTFGALNVGVTGGTGTVNIVTTSSNGATFTSGNPTTGTFSTTLSTFYAVTATPDQGGTPCTYIVILVSADTTPPTFTICPNAITVNNLGCTATTTTQSFLATATDNCGAVSVTYTSTGATVFSQTQTSANFNLGTSFVTATARDSSNNQNTVLCTFPVAVARGPTISCTNTAVAAGNTFTVTTPTNCGFVGNPTITYTNLANQFPLGSLTLAPGATGTLNQLGFASGTNTVRAVANDNSGNTAQCDFTVTVTTAFTLTCPASLPVVYTCGATTATVNIQSSVNGGTGTVNPITWQSAPSGVTFSTNTGVTTAFLPTSMNSYQIFGTVSDSGGNSASCSFPAPLTQSVDSTPPVVACPTSTIIQDVQCGTTSAAVNFQVTSATDNCGAVTTTYFSTGATVFPSSPNSVAVMNLGTSNIVATATDTSGLTSTCPITVIVRTVDTTAPQVTCRSSIPQTVPCGTPNTQVNFAVTTATDNCGTPTTTYTSTGTTVFTNNANNQALFNVGQSNIVATVRDATGLTATCLSLVTITEVDTTAPTIQCQTPATVDVQCGTATSPVSFAVATSQETCGTAPIVYTAGTISFPAPVNNVVTATFGVGTTSVRARATNSAGLTADCFFNVVVRAVDTIQPTVTCQPRIPLTVTCGTPNTVVNFAVTSAQDNCGTASVSYASTGATVLVNNGNGQGTMNVGTSVVTATARDAAGLTRTCTTEVVVSEVDNVQPTITACTPNQQSTVCTGATSVPINFPDTVSTDNCVAARTTTYASAGVTVFVAQAQSSANFNAGTSVVTATVTDGSNNQRTCTFNVQVTAQNPCTNHGCQNGGQCIGFPGSCTQYYCTCPPCYYGQFCQNRVDQCNNNKCANGGVCQVQPNSCTDYRCVCPNCFTGQFCRDTYNPCTAGTNPCLNSGVCSNMADSCASFSCQCRGCFTGYRCQLAIASPCTVNPCQNNGACSRVSNTCYSYQCTCPSGFMGYHCETPTAVYVNSCNNFPCQNAGTCTCLGSGTNLYVCSCRSGYSGINCQTSLTVSPQLNSCGTTIACQNSATCYNAYDGSSSPNNVYSNQYTCVCPPGFSGTNCGSNQATNPALNTCTATTCRNNGNCRNAYYSFSQTTASFCVCPVGFAGQYCQKAVPNPCNSLPCQNGGVCTPFNNHFICVCVGTFSGVTCEVSSAFTGDTTPPVVTCPPDRTVTSSVQTPVTYTQLATATDNSGATPTITYSPVSGSTFTLGANTVTVTATDPSSNQMQCTFRITVTPVSSTPVVTCPPAQTRVAAQGATSALVTYSPMATSNDGSSISYSPTSGSSFNVNIPTTVYAFATNAAGTGFCMFTVTVSPFTGGDTTPPVVTCPPARTVTSSVQTPVTYTQLAIATDNSGAIPTITYSPVSGSTFALGATTVTVTATDPSSNQIQCTFTITVSPMLTVTCPPDQIAASNFAPKAVYYSAATATGGTSTYTYQYTNPSGSTFNRGVTTVTVTAFSGTLSGTCTFTVTLNAGLDDIQAPILTCPLDQSLNVANAQTPTTATYTAPTISDPGAGGVPYIYSITTNTGATPGSGTTAYAIGTTTITASGRDSSGNLGTCTFAITVNVNGLTVPTITGCPATSPTNANVNAVLPSAATTVRPTWTQPTSNVAPVAIPAGALSGIYDFSQGLTTIKYVFGTAGAQAVCTFYVYVRGVGVNQCASNPCTSQQGNCFFYIDGYMCFDIGSQGRRRRDVEAEGCDASCHQSGGVCLTKDASGNIFPPTCYYQGASFDLPAGDPCDYMQCNNGTCVSFDAYMNRIEPQCQCPTGVTGRFCEQLEENRDLDVYGESDQFAFWFITVVLSLLGFVILLLGGIVCRLVTARVSSIQRGADEKVLIH